MKKNVDTQPSFQRELVWKTATKQLLIDTILRGYDMPKFYWEEVSKDKYKVIDGQQRINAIWDFKENKYKLQKNNPLIDNEDVSEKTYEKLSLDMKQIFDSSSIDVIVISEADSESEIIDMFLRLQSGVTLKAQEKRKAMMGKMRDFVEEISKHNFFSKVDYKNIRFSHQQTVAQITLLELSGCPTEVKSAYLNKMYDQHNKNFDANGSVAKKIKRVLEFMNKIFKENTPGLKNYYVISFYTLISLLLEKYVLSDMYEKIFDWYKEFDQYRINEKNKDEEEEMDPDIADFQDKITHASDGKASIEWRQDYLLRKFLVKFPEIITKDENRNFTDEQKRAIYFRDAGICKVEIKCNGKKLTWNNWHADHIKPYAQGGKTIVSNGRVSCPECNLSRGTG